MFTKQESVRVSSGFRFPVVLVLVSLAVGHSAEGPQKKTSLYYIPCLLSHTHRPAPLSLVFSIHDYVCHSLVTTCPMHKAFQGCIN